MASEARGAAAGGGIHGRRFALLDKPGTSVSRELGHDGIGHLPDSLRRYRAGSTQGLQPSGEQSGDRLKVFVLVKQCQGFVRLAAKRQVACQGRHELEAQPRQGRARLPCQFHVSVAERDGFGGRQCETDLLVL